MYDDWSAGHSSGYAAKDASLGSMGVNDMKPASLDNTVQLYQGYNIVDGTDFSPEFRDEDYFCSFPSYFLYTAGFRRARQCRIITMPSGMLNG
jgi:hypothetical protein